MGRIFFVAAALLFFFDAAGANILPRQTAWGLVAMALGLACGGWTLPSLRRPAA